MEKSGGASLVVKVQFNSQNIRLRISKESSLSLQAFKSALKSELFLTSTTASTLVNDISGSNASGASAAGGEGDLSLKYFDEENHLIDILSDKHLQEAISVVEDFQLGSLKLICSLLSSGSPSPPAKGSGSTGYSGAPAEGDKVLPLTPNNRIGSRFMLNSTAASASIANNTNNTNNNNSNNGGRHPLANALLKDISDTHDRVAQKVIDWWLTKMPEAYFREIDHETRQVHLRALIALQMTGQKNEVSLLDKAKNLYTVIKPSNYVGLLSEVIKSLPADRRLKEANIYTSVDDDLVIDVFEFESSSSSAASNANSVQGADGTGGRRKETKFSPNLYPDRFSDVLKSFRHIQQQQQHQRQEEQQSDEKRDNEEAEEKWHRQNDVSEELLSKFLMCCEQSYVLNSPVSEVIQHFLLICRARDEENVFSQLETNIFQSSVDDPASPLIPSASGPTDHHLLFSMDSVETGGTSFGLLNSNPVANSGHQRKPSSSSNSVITMSKYLSRLMIVLPPVANQDGAFGRIVKHLGRLHVDIQKATLVRIYGFQGTDFLILTFYIRSLAGPIDKESELAGRIKEEIRHLPFLDDLVFEWMDGNSAFDLFTLRESEIVVALCKLAHSLLAEDRPLVFTNYHIMQFVKDYHLITKDLVRLFEVKFLFPVPGSSSSATGSSNTSPLMHQQQLLNSSLLSPLGHRNNQQQLFHVRPHETHNLILHQQEQSEQQQMFNRQAVLSELQSQIRAQIEKQIELEDCRLFFTCLLNCCLNHIQHVNLDNLLRLSLTMRLDGRVYKERFSSTSSTAGISSLSSGPGLSPHAEVPYSIYYSVGRGYQALHLRFRDIARGGLRIVEPQSIELYTVANRNLFSDCYSLAAAQHLKNKDIPEGGAKAMILLEPQKSTAENAIKAFVDGLLDLTCDNDQRQGQQSAIISKKSKRGQEFVFLGPDESLKNEQVVIEWICQRALHRNYAFPNTFISSKPGAGISHRVYAAISTGLVVFLDVAIRNIGIDPREQSFSVKITGGPQGETSGNLILLLHKYFGSHARIVAISDHSGVAEDPSGLDCSELRRLVTESLPIVKFSKSKLSHRGHIISVHEGGSGLKARNSMPFRVESDVFIPADGKTYAITDTNWKSFLFDTNSTSHVAAIGSVVSAGRKIMIPTSKLIIEGSNLYISPTAKQNLANHGCLIIPDSTVTKGGVICSSYEILASMLLTTEQEFMAIKEAYVSEVIDRLKHFCRMECEMIFKEYQNARKKQQQQYPPAASGPGELLQPAHRQHSLQLSNHHALLPDLCGRLSRAIIQLKENLYRSKLLDIYAMPIMLQPSSEISTSTATAFGSIGNEGNPVMFLNRPLLQVQNTSASNIIAAPANMLAPPAEGSFFIESPPSPNKINMEMLSLSRNNSVNSDNNNNSDNSQNPSNSKTNSTNEKSGQKPLTALNLTSARKMAKELGFVYVLEHHVLCRDLLLEYVPPTLKSKLKMSSSSGRSSIGSETGVGGLAPWAIDEGIPGVYKKRILATAISCKIVYREGLDFLDRNNSSEDDDNDYHEHYYGIDKVADSKEGGGDKTLNNSKNGGRNRKRKDMAEWSLRYLVELDRTKKVIESVMQSQDLETGVKQHIVQLLERGGTRISLELFK